MLYGKRFASSIIMLAGAVVPAFCADTKFPVVMRMDSARINGNVVSGIGDFFFPEYSGGIDLVARWASSMKGQDVRVTLTINNDTLTFSPNYFDPISTITLKGVKAVTVATADVTDVYDVTSGGVLAGFKRVVLVTRSGNLLFHLDGDSTLDILYYWDFDKARSDLVNGLAHVCRRAAFHHSKD